MYRPQRRLWWSAEAEHQVAEKRAKLAAQGYVSDDEVCEWFKAQGIECEPADIHPMMMDAVSASPFQKVMAALAD